MLPALQSIKSLVVRCPNWVGDVVMATPILECLRLNFPDIVLTACIRPYARGIIEDNPWLDHIVDCDDKSFGGLRKIRRELRPLRPDAGLLLTNTTHSLLTFKFAGIKRNFGYRRNLRKYFLSAGPQPQMRDGKVVPMPMQDYYLQLCRFLGLQLPANPKPALFVSDKVRLEGLRRLSNYGISPEEPVIGLNPGASFGSSKCWPTESFARLAEMLQEKYHCKLLLLAGPGEADIAHRIVSASKARIINTAKDHIDLALLKPLIKRCNLLITNDTGPRHYAVAFDIPHIVLMGPTNPLYTASNLELASVLRRDLPCMPCHKKVCPLGHHACMTEITPEIVMQEVERRMPRGLQ